jgi:hypothetical protein
MTKQQTPAEITARLQREADAISRRHAKRRKAKRDKMQAHEHPDAADAKYGDVEGCV